MKVFLENFNINLKILIIIVFFITILTIAFTTYRDELIPVNGQQKELPIYSVDCPDKKVAITFDCAWGAGDIPDILSTLKKENIKATFFIVGQWAQKFPAVVKSISDEGHDIANHSDTHVRMGSIDKSEIISELSRCSDKLQTITGKKVCLFRAPYGEYNDLLIRTAKNLGYYTIQWDVDTLNTKVKHTQSA